MERGFLSPGRDVKKKSGADGINQPKVKSILKKPSVVTNKDAKNVQRDMATNSSSTPSFMHKNLRVDELDKLNTASGLNSVPEVLVSPVQSEKSMETQCPSKATKTSYLNVATAEIPKEKVNFRSLKSDSSVNEADVVIPLSSVEEVNNRFSNTLYGYFIGKRIAFPVVENYVRNAWSKYGIQKVMMNARGFFFFKFSSSNGMNSVLENGPWMIRTAPVILNQWAPSVSLTKEDLTKVPIWVKLHDVPMAAFTGDGLSMIATMLGNPLRLDSYTTSMCVESWGRNSFARALIEVTADHILKDNITVAIPKLDGSGYTRESVRVEYEWKPPRCDCCCLFGHLNDQCPSQAKKENTNDGFVEVGSKGAKANKQGLNTRKFEGINLGKQKSTFVYRPKVAANKEKSKSKEDIKVSTSNSFSVLSGNDSKMDDVLQEVDTTMGAEKDVHGNKVNVSKVAQNLEDNQESKKSNSNVDKIMEDSESDVEDIYDETSQFMAYGSGSGGGGGASNLEYYDDDDFYGDYDDQVYDLTEEQQAFCKAFDINLRGQIKR